MKTEELPFSTGEEAPSYTEPEEVAEEFPLSTDEADEEPHFLLAALATVTPISEPSVNVERESSPLPCQLLIPE